MTKMLLKIENGLRYRAQLLYLLSSIRNFILSYLVHHTMLHSNSVKLLTGMHTLSSPFLFINPFSPGNSHPELAAAVAER